MDAEEQRERSLKILDTVGLDGFETAYPKELSGGMQPARRICPRPGRRARSPLHGRALLRPRRADRREPAQRTARALWHKKTIPTKAIFIVTHNIEEAVLLADRIIVLGTQPRLHPHRFQGDLAPPRDRKSAAFTQLRGLHLQGADPARTRSLPSCPARPPASRSQTRALATTRCCPTRAPAASPDCSSCCSTTTAQRRHLPPGRRPRPSRSTTCCPSSMRRTCSASSPWKRATPRSLPPAHEFANAEILRQKELFRKAALAQRHCCCARSRRALEAKQRPHASPKNSSTICWTSSSAKRRASASWRPPSAGDAMRSCSITTPPQERFYPAPSREPHRVKIAASRDRR